MRLRTRFGTLVCALAVVIVEAAVCFAAAAQQRQAPLEVARNLHITVPQGWSQSEHKYRNAIELVSPPSAEQGNRGFQARTVITVEDRRNHEEAVQRLSEIAAEVHADVQFVEISGWPALERTYKAPLERPGEKELESPQMALRATTAIAVENQVVQFQTELVPGADPKLAEQMKSVARSAVIAAKARPGQAEEELRRVRELWQKRVPQSVIPSAPRYTKEKPGTEELAGREIKPRPKVRTGFTRDVQAGFGELEVAASNDGQTIVVAANSGYANSTDGGQTFTSRGGLTVGFPRDGDPSMAFAVSGAFYQSFIGFPNGSAAALGVSGCSTGITRSTDNGVTFPFISHAVVCPNSGAICFPDQEHIAADNINAAPGGDQVYSVWRNFLPAGTVTSCSFGSGFVTAALVCSANNGSTWTAPTLMPGGSDFPRVSVGPDGFVYVAYRSGGNVMLNKFSSCSAGLVQQVGFPVTVSAFTDVVCPVAGLDRCNDGNVLSSPMVAVDDSNPNHVFVAFASNTAAGNENVQVRDSIDGGATFPRVVSANAAVTGRRYMPWLCSLGGTAFVSWYDRRTATAAAPDATNYYLGSAFVHGGTLQPGGEENLTVNADRECATGFPCGARSPADFTACSTTGTVGSGCPKYGDYNGNACAGGRIYTAWASATSPPGLPAVAGLNVFASVTSRMYFCDAKEPTGSVYEIVGGTATPVFTFSGALAGNQAYHSAFNPSTNKLYVSNANKFNLYSVDSTTGLASIEYTHTTYLRDVAFDPSGKFYFSESSGAGGDGKIYLLNLTTHVPTLFYTVHLPQVGGFWAGDFTFSPDGHLYLSTGNEIGAHIYRVDNPALASPPVTVYSIATESVTGIAFDRSGQLFYTNWDGTNGYIYQLNLSTSARNLVFSSPGRMIWDVSFR